MIETDTSDARILIVRLRGLVLTREFSGIARLMEGKQMSHFQMLQDWRLLKRWNMEGWSVAALQPWSAAAPHFKSVAIIHDGVWNRQAALFAAILRRENVLVRSWRPGRLSNASQWLLDLA